MARGKGPPQEPDKGNGPQGRKAVGCPMGAGECADWRLWTGRPRSRDMSARKRKTTRPNGRHTTATRARRMAAPTSGGGERGAPARGGAKRLAGCRGAGVAVASGRAGPAPQAGATRAASLGDRMGGSTTARHDRLRARALACARVGGRVRGGVPLFSGVSGWFVC